MAFCPPVLKSWSSKDRVHVPWLLLPGLEIVQGFFNSKFPEGSHSPKGQLIDRAVRLDLLIAGINLWINQHSIRPWDTRKWKKRSMRFDPVLEIIVSKMHTMELTRHMSGLRLEYDASNLNEKKRIVFEIMLRLRFHKSFMVSTILR